MRKEEPIPRSGTVLVIPFTTDHLPFSITQADLLPFQSLS